jgi:hypothetical protein
LGGFGYNLVFDPKVPEVTAVDGSQIAKAAGNLTPFEEIDADATNGPQSQNRALSVTTGKVRAGCGILLPSPGSPSSSGVLSRLTLTAVGTGLIPVTVRRALGTLPLHTGFGEETIR